MSTPQTRPTARFVKPGEMLAMAREHVHSGPQGFFWLFGGGTRASERRGDVAIVHVRDALEHHSTYWADNYEDILCRVRDAMSGEDDRQRRERARQEAEWRQEWDPQDDYVEQPPCEAIPPAAVVLCLDSPGGVVSGLNETVRALRKASNDSGIPLIAYVNEMAASAAYALACACDQIVCPESAIIGSIGVISTMVSQAEADKKMGLDFRLITSGARKADGHVHAPITDAALEAEAGRVEKLASAFFKIASAARGIPVDTIESFQASIFLGKQAKKRGLADAVMSFDDAIAALSNDAPADKPTPAPNASGGNETDRRESRASKQLDVRKKNRSQHVLTTLSATRDAMPPIQLKAMIKRTEAAVAAEKDPKKRKALLADLEAYKRTEAGYKKVEKHVEHIKSEEDDDDDEEDQKGDEEDEEEEDEESKKSEEKKAAKGAEDEEEEAAEEKKSEGKKAEEKKAAASVYKLAAAATGKTGSAVYGALAGLLDKAAQYDDLNKRVSSIESQSRKSKRDTLITEAINAGRITKAMVKRAGLATKKLEMVESYLEMFPTALINTSEEDLHEPDTSAESPHAKGAALPKHVVAQIDAALAAAPASMDRAALRERLEANHRRTLNGASNVRY